MLFFKILFFMVIFINPLSLSFVSAESVTTTETPTTANEPDPNTSKKVATATSSECDMPVPNGKISDHFKYILHPLTGKKALLDRITIPAPKGTPAVAVLDGVIRQNKTIKTNKRGYFVEIQHDDGTISIYESLEPSCPHSPQANTRVKKGQPIGCVGNTGNVLTSMLVFKMQNNKKEPLDPEQRCQFKK